MSRVRLALAMAGFASALLAVMTEDRGIGWLAIALIAASLLFRLLQPKPSSEDRRDGPDPQ